MTLLIILLFLFQLALFIVGLLGPWRDANATGHLPRAARMLLSFSLVVAAAFLIWGGGSRIPVYAQWVFFGMCASFVGDLVMARLIPFPNRLFGGMLAFGVAHLLYITAYHRTLQTISALEPYNRFALGLVIGLVFYGLVLGLVWWFLIRNPRKGTILNVGALAYGGVIAVMASFALALALALGGAFWLTALGGLLLLCSDFIIGMTNIHDIPLTNANDWIWLTYVAGQMGIIYASAIV